MSSQESSGGYSSQALLRRSIRRTEQCDVSVSLSADGSGSESDGEATSLPLHRAEQATSDGDGASREEDTPLNAFEKRRRLLTERDLKTSYERGKSAKKAQKKKAAQAQGKEAEPTKREKRKEQVEALKTLPVFGSGPGRCSSIVLDRHDDKPSSSTEKSVIALSKGRNWPSVGFEIPKSHERPWSPPRDHICVYECFFDLGGLGFPIPPIIFEYCARRRISISQLTHAGFRNLMSILTLGYEAGRKVTCDHLEQACEIARGNTFESGRFQIKIKNGLALVNNFENRPKGNWQEKYFFVKMDEKSIGNYRGEIRIGWNRKIDSKTQDLPGESSGCVIGFLRKQSPQDWPSFLNSRIRLVYNRIVSGIPTLPQDIAKRVHLSSDKEKMENLNIVKPPLPRRKAKAETSAPTTSEVKKLDVADESAGKPVASAKGESAPRSSRKRSAPRGATGTALKKRSGDESAPVAVKHGAGKDLAVMMDYKRACEVSGGSSQDLVVSTAEGVDMPASTEHERQDVEMADAVQVVELIAGNEENQLNLINRDELDFSDHFSYAFKGSGHISEHPEECAKYINPIRGGASGPNPALEDIIDREGYDRTAANLVGVVADFNLTWKRLNSSMERERELKKERDSLKEERDSGNARIEALIKEVESLKSGGIAKELEMLKERYEGRGKMLNEASEQCHVERREKAAVERKYEDVRDRLIRAGEVNKALIEHVRTHIPRLRSSRSEHGLSCARKAADQVRTELVGRAQAFIDQALSRAHKHYDGKLELGRLNSLASQVETQLDMISEYELDVEVEEVKANLDEYREKIKALQLTDISDEDYNFVPEASVLPASYDEGIPESPLGENCGIERGWILDPYVSEWTDPALDEDEEETRDNEQVAEPEQDAGDKGQDVGVEQNAEGILAAITSTSPRSVTIVEQFFIGIILRVAERLIDEIADRIVTEPAATDPTLAKDPVTGEDLEPLFTQTPAALTPSSSRPE